MRLKDKVKNNGINPKYYQRLAEIESSNNPLAQAKTSSAAGLYQFTKGTWEGLVKQAGLDYTLEDRFDPEKSKKVVEIFTNQNRNYITNKIGKEPNQSELYLTHFLGMGTAGKFLENAYSTPDLKVDQVIPESALNANKNVFFNKDGSPKRLRDVYNWASNKFGEKALKTTEDEVVYSTDKNGNYVTVNPKKVTPIEANTSDIYKDQFYSEYYNTNESLTNYEVPKENGIFAEQKQGDSEEKQDPWKQKLQKKIQERDNLIGLINQGYLDVSTPQYNRSTNTAQKIAQSYMQDGGQIPVSKDGLYDYPNQQVIVPTTNGKITMKGIKYPVKGISLETGEEIIMQPEQEYSFKNTKTVLEIPQINE